VRLSPLLLSLALCACSASKYASEAPMASGGEGPGAGLTTDRSIVRNASLRVERDAPELRVDFEKPVRPGPVGWVFYGLAKGIKWLFIWE